MQVRVICKDGSGGSVADYDLNDFIRTSKASAFLCPVSNEWVEIGHGFCDNCSLRHLTSADDSRECVIHRLEKVVNN